MEMIDQELMRLKNRMNDLQNRIVPEFENRTTALFSQIMQMPEGSDGRQHLEAEYTLLAKELTMRSDEIISIRQQMENLELQKSMR